MAGILQILFDDLGYRDFGCQGHPDILTPNVDAIATAGVRYTKFLATPACSTTRATLLTGYPPQYWGIHHVDLPASGTRMWLPAHVATVSRRLQRLGWKTAHFGKTHWGAPPHTLHPARFGYDRFLGVLHGSPNAQFSGYARYQDTYLHDSPGAAPQVYAGHVEDVLFAQAEAWITARENAGEDWYCEIWLFTPHEPLVDSNVAEESLYPSGSFSDREIAYYGSISHADTLIGDLVDAIDALGALSTTTIAVGSENGPEPHIAQFPRSAGTTAPYRGWKTSLYMGGIAVPWIMRGPGITADTTDDRFRGIEDWVPTVLAIAGYDTSGIPGGLPGADLLTTPATRYLCREYHGLPKRNVTPAIADEEWTVVKADADSKWKLYRSDASGTGDKLFDINADPGETTDVAGSNGAIVTELQAELDAWVATWEPEGDGTHSFTPEDPQTELEAVTAQPEPEVTQLLVRCVDASDRTSKAALLDKALGYPRTVPCSHGLTGATVSEYAPADVDHPTQLDRVCLRTGAELTIMIDDQTIAARLNASEQTEFFEMCTDAHVAPVA